MSKSLAYVPKYNDGVLPSWAESWSHEPDVENPAWPVREVGAEAQIEDDGSGPGIYSRLLDGDAVAGRISDPALARALARDLEAGADILEALQA